jgi:hypothetical protein
MAKKIIKRKRNVRNIKTASTVETASERQTKSAISFIMRNPRYTMILNAIRQGTPLSKIAEWGVSNGIFDVNQKTAVGYLQYFRKAQPELCRPQAPQGAAATIAGYDHLFEGMSIVIDEETELLKLIQLQKARIGIGFNNERNIAILMQANRREVEELRNLLMDLAKLRGLVGGSLDINVKNYNANVVDDLKGIKQDENQRGMIATLVSDLARETAL